jgi:hypothetical protein
MTVIKRSASGRCLLAFLGVLASACTPVLDADFWREYQARAQADGLMRTDRAPADATFSNADLIENFRQIIFFAEYASEDGEFRAVRMPQNLEKHTGAVGYSVEGDGVSDQDLSQIAGIATRISRVTGLKIHNSEEEDSLIWLMILNRAERNGLSAGLPENGNFEAIRKDLANDLGGDICVAYPMRQDDGPIIHLIVIPDELSGLLRQSCIEEEFGQAFGPSADYDQARPSIFNDDEEFSLFTIHDELLFRVLYDPRLKPGMSEQEAMPIVRQIVEELRPEQSKAGS